MRPEYEETGSDFEEGMSPGSFKQLVVDSDRCGR